MRRLAALIMVMALVIGMAASYEVTAGTSSFKPVIQVTQVSDEEIVVGETQVIKFTMENVGRKFATDFSFNLLIPEGSPLKSKSIIQNGFVSAVNPGDKMDFDFEFTTQSISEDGVYPVEFKGYYFDKEGNSYDFDEFIYLKLVKDDHRARLKLAYDETQAIYSESTYTREFALNNVGNNTIDYVEVKLESSDESQFVEKTSEALYLETLVGGGSKSFDYEFYVPAGVTGYQKGTFVIDYREGEVHKQVKVEFRYNVMEHEQNLVVNKVAMSHESVASDVKFSMDVDVVNISEKEAKEVQVNVLQSKDITVISDSYKLINTLAPGEHKTLSFDFKGVKGLESANYPIEIEVVYNDGKKTISATSGIYIKNPEKKEDKDNSSAPRIAVEEFKLSQDQVFVGDEFDIDMTIVNTSTEKKVKNLKVIIEATDSNGEKVALIPVGSSNSRYIGSLAIGESSSINMPYKVMGNAKGGMYSMAVSFEYEDSDHNSFKDSELLTLPVYEDIKMSLSDVRLGNVLDSGYTLELDFYNTGKIDIHNMMVDIEGDFEALNSNYYVGDFLSGRMDVYEVQLRGALPGEIKGTITFNYDDTFGEEARLEKAFTIINDLPEDPVGLVEGDGTTVMAQGIDGVRTDDMDGGESVDGIKAGQIAGGIGVVVLVGITIMIIFLKKRKKVS